MSVDKTQKIVIAGAAVLLLTFGVVAVASASDKKKKTIGTIDPNFGQHKPTDDPADVDDDDKPSYDPWDPSDDGPSDDPSKPFECPPGFVVSVQGGYRHCVPESPPKPDTPPVKIDDIIKSVPVPGNFYQVRKGDIFLGKKVTSGTSALSICYMALRRAAHDAAMKHGNMDDTAAWQYANLNGSTIGDEKDSLRPYLALLGCGWWNDEGYASWKYTSGQATPNANGRAIGLNPQHAPNLDRMRDGDAPARNVPLGKPAQKGTGPAIGVNKSWHHYPALWIPEIDLEAYFTSGLKVIKSAGTWSDGSDRSSPPPELADRGWTDFTGTIKSGTMFGCGSGSMEVD